jgi:phospholipid/cholesterol/gamma-HCH transport system substrate-binding protein
MRNESVETLIGAVVIAVAAFFLFFAYRSAGSFSSAEGYELTAKLSRVDGISEGTDVRLSGIKIGTVSSLTLDPSYLVTVHMDIKNDVKIPDDSSLVVTSSGLLGSSYLSISPGGSDKMLAEGGMIRNTQGSVDLMGLISRFAGVGANGGNNNGTPQPSAPKP